MDAGDITFPMRSGLLDDNSLSHSEKQEVVALLYVFMENALTHASKFVEDSGRTVVLPKDVSYGLKFAALRDRFWEAEDLPERQRAALQIIRTEEDDEDDDELTEDIPSEIWCKPTGDTAYDETIAAWEAWNPTNPIDLAVKRAVAEVDRTLTD